MNANVQFGKEGIRQTMVKALATWVSSLTDKVFKPAEDITMTWFESHVSRVTNSRTINTGDDWEQEDMADDMGDGEGADVEVEMEMELG